MLIKSRAQASGFNTPHGSQITPLIDRTTSGISQCSLAEELLPPGHTVPAHHHEVLEEIYYILEGTGEMTVGGETRPVAAGDAIFIPTGNIHTLTNTGATTMRLLLICGPAFYFEDHLFEK